MASAINKTQTKLTMPKDSCSLSDTSLNVEMQKFFDLATIGLLPHCKQTDMIERKRFISKFSNKVKYDEIKQTYIVQIPWREPRLHIEDMLQSSVQQLNSHTKLLVKLGLLSDYNNYIQDFLNRKFISLVDENLQNAKTKNCTYMSHFGIINPNNKSTPLRIVFRCDRRGKNNVSLNSAAYAGANLLPKITVMILKSRLSPILVISDIFKAFPAIQIAAVDQDRFRFLWFHHGDPNKEIKIYKFTNLLFGFISSPFILFAIIQMHLKRFLFIDKDLSKKFPENVQPVVAKFAKLLHESLYSDNCLVGFDSEDVAIQFCEISQNIMALGNFKLTKFLSNNEAVMTSLPAECKQEDIITSLLGLEYNRSTDMLKIKTPENIEPHCILTKRKVLQKIASIYDPLGNVGTLLLFGQKFLQKLWENQNQNPTSKHWDSPLMQEQGIVFREYFQHIIKIIDKFQFPRHLPFIQGKNLILHAFSDASPSCALGMVIYATQNNTNITLAFITGKFKLVSKKLNGTTPKLELAAIVLSKRLVISILPALENTYKITNIRIYSDSTIALSQIAMGKSEDSFVQRRLQELSQPINNIPVTFHYCNSELNVADELTKISAVPPKLSQRYTQGPEFLLNEQNWLPIFQSSENINAIQCAIVTQKQSHNKLNVFMELEERISTFNKLLRIIGHCIIFIGKLQARVTDKNKHFKQTINFPTKMSPDTLNLAENILLRFMQQKYINDIYTYCKTKRGIKSALIKQLHLFFDSQFQLVRVQTRIPLPQSYFGQKQYPIFLPAKCKFTEKVIRHFHMLCMHGNINVTLTSIRTKFWLQTKRTIQKVIRDCTTCTRYGQKPLKKMPLPQFPKERLCITHPFRSLTCDLTGAFSVKINDEVKKLYVIVFSSLSCRYVTADICMDLTTEAFINALKRQFARYGWAQDLFCDRGSNFVSGFDYFKTLSNMLENNETNNFFIQNQIKFHFSPAKDASCNGASESAVRIFKHSFKRIVHRKLLNFDDFNTIVQQSTAFVNTRPLCSNNNQLIDDIDVLTPEKLLYGHELHVFPTLEPHDSDENDDYYDPTGTDLRNYWTSKQKLLEKFRDIFTTEYYAYLNEENLKRTKYFKHNSTVLTKNQIVLIADDEKKPIHYKLGKLLEPIKSYDTYIRSWNILIHDENCNCIDKPAAKCKTRIITRSINRLIPLFYETPLETEITTKDTTISQQTINTMDKTNIDKQTRQQQPQRTHKLKAKEKIKNLFINNE